MARTRVKICGITRPEDAALAAQLGADAVGMVFYPQARRHISPEQARAVLHALPPFVTPVALFVDQPLSMVRSIITTLGIHHVQLHGRESAETVGALRDRFVLKALQVDPATFEQTLDHWRERIASQGLTNLKGLVLETASAAPGGTGIANDWAFIADCAQRGLFAGLPPIIAAGGLTPQTVGDVVRTIRPAAVDVSSGVESTFGQKDPQKVAAFIHAVRTADSE